MASLPNGSTTLTNTAVVSADQTVVNNLNNEVSVVTIVEDRADLQLSKVCKPDRPLLSGETATCTLFVDNLGLILNVCDGVF